jgi:hypothetical protein
MQLRSLSKRPNLKLKTRPKQLLGSLPLAFALHNAIDPSIFLRCLWLCHSWKAAVAKWLKICLVRQRFRVRVQPPSLVPKRENDKERHFISGNVSKCQITLLKGENSAQTTFRFSRFSPISFCPPRCHQSVYFS